jgi:hypothetical protein
MKFSMITLSPRVLSPMGEPAPLPAVTASVPASRGLRLVAYVGTAAAALAFAIIGYRLDVTSLHAPLMHEPDQLMFNDTLLILPMVQSTLEGGTHWTTPRLGAPAGQDMHDFPVIDHLHFAMIWLLGQVLPSAVVVFNVYYLLTYPLAALSMMAVLRHFHVSLASAAAAGVYYAALPYHQYRSENHYFLSAYFMVPPACLYMLEICRGRLPFFSLSGNRFSPFSVNSLIAVVMMLAVASAGAYYAFFACGLYVCAGAYTAVTTRTLKPLISAGMLVAIVTAGGVANHLPTFIYQAHYGKHPSPIERSPEESEHYGLKLTQLLLPIDDHNIRVFADYKAIYNSYVRPVQSYTERYSLGLVASVGFVSLTLRMLFMLPRRWPSTDLSVMTMFAVMIGVVGGLGAIFNQTITPAVRCYNRIAIFIGVFVLFEIAIIGDRLIGWLAGKTVIATLRRGMPLLVWVPVLIGGLIEMTPYEFGTDKRAQRIQKHQQRWFVDAEFFREIEQIMNAEGTEPGPAVFQLPYIHWPESASIHKLGAYELARGYLHTRTLRWSFGCIRGREQDEWYRNVMLMAPQAVPPMLDRIALGGFEGLLLDKRGYTPSQAKAIEEELNKAIGGAVIVRHPDGEQIFYDLRRHTHDIRQGRDWQAAAYRETHRPVILWLEGFCSHKDPGYEWTQRWGGPKCTALFVNPTNETKTIISTFRISTDMKDPGRLVIDGGDIWKDDLEISRTSPAITRTFVIPPGRHVVKFVATPPESHIPTEHRRLTFVINGLKLD